VLARADSAMDNGRAYQADDEQLALQHDKSS
jgi:hypothetical protein